MVHDSRNDSSDSRDPLAVELTPLPPGRHGLSREAVQRNRRERLIAGAAKAVEERGLMNVTVADIIRHARISRPTFYELFANKEECIEAAYGTSLASLQEKEWKRRFGPPVTRGRSETSGSGDSSKPSPTELTPLPPGRHGLPREVVQRNQRERMIAAAAKAVAERGLMNVTVADIIRHARISKRTFYEHFANKEECFVAARELLAEQKQDQGAAAIQSATDDTSNSSGLAHRQKELISHYQRERLIAGAAKAVEERGLMNVTVADIIRHARISRRTFYDRFAGKEECIEAAYGTSLASLQEKEWKRRFGSPVTPGRNAEPAPLPAGPHGLPREVVQRNQRERMIAGVAKAVEERGYVSVAVSDIIRHAGVSRPTFYEHFANKEECFEAARGISLIPEGEEPN